MAALASNAQIRDSLTGRAVGADAAWADPAAVAAVTEAARLLWPAEPGTRLGLDGMDSVFGTPGFRGLRHYGIDERAIASVIWRTCMARRAVTRDGRTHLVCHEDDPVEVSVHFRRLGARGGGCEFVELPARTLRIYGTGELPFAELAQARLDVVSLAPQAELIEALHGDQREASTRRIMRELRERRVSENETAREMGARADAIVSRLAAAVAADPD